MAAFKARLEQYKASTIASGESSQGHFWELSEILISKINNCNHDSYAEYMSANPSLAKFKGINTYLFFSCIFQCIIITVGNGIGFRYILRRVHLQLAVWPKSLLSSLLLYFMWLRMATMAMQS